MLTMWLNCTSNICVREGITKNITVLTMDGSRQLNLRRVENQAEKYLKTDTADLILIVPI